MKSLGIRNCPKSCAETGPGRGGVFRGPPLPWSTCVEIGGSLLGWLDLRILQRPRLSLFLLR